MVRSSSVMEVTKKMAVLRSGAAMDSPIVCELPRGTAVMIGSHRCTVKDSTGKDVDRVKIERPVVGYSSFKCLGASSQKAPMTPAAALDAKISDVLASDAAADPTSPRIAGEGAKGVAVVLGFWGSSHDLVAAHTALWVDRGFKVWTHIPTPGDDLEPLYERLAAFLGGAHRRVVHALSNNGFSFLNGFCKGHSHLLARAVVVFDSAPHVPETDGTPWPCSSERRRPRSARR